MPNAVSKCVGNKAQSQLLHPGGLGRFLHGSRGIHAADWMHILGEWSNKVISFHNVPSWLSILSMPTGLTRELSDRHCNEGACGLVWSAGDLWAAHWPGVPARCSRRSPMETPTEYQHKPAEKITCSSFPNVIIQCKWRSDKTLGTMAAIEPPLAKLRSNHFQTNCRNNKMWEDFLKSCTRLATDET